MIGDFGVTDPDTDTVELALLTGWCVFAVVEADVKRSSTKSVLPDTVANLWG